MRNLFFSKLIVVGIACSTVGYSLSILSADARRAYDTSGSSTTPTSTSTSTTTTTSSASTSSTQYPYAINHYSPSTTPTNSSTSPWTPQPSSTSVNHYTPPQNHDSALQNQDAHPKAHYKQLFKQILQPLNGYTPLQNQYTLPQNQYTRTKEASPYHQQTKYNGTNFYGISPDQISGGAAVHQDTLPSNSGGGRGGYDPRWNPNFGTGAGAQMMARESGSLAQSLKDNFPLPMSGDEAQMFQVNDFAARSNGGMQNRTR